MMQGGNFLMKKAMVNAPSVLQRGCLNWFTRQTVSYSILHNYTPERAQRCTFHISIEVSRYLSNTLNIL